ncbi:trehalose-phosphatase [Arthrobacter gandavensis]|uniref:Trehalose 6-phosphate phosphatase n=2 Tax=Arthrobacter TaxID=1663 RepID=A0ABP5AZN4_9MICC
MIPMDLRSALATLAAADSLLVAVDFDGTLAPLVERAEDARPLPAAAAALRSLASAPGTSTALISGRALDSLRAVAEPEPETLLVGSHGAETWTGPNAAPLELTPEQADLLVRARAAVAEVAQAWDGCRLEDKPAGVVLHTRSASDDDAAAAVDAARARLGKLDGVQVTDGKRVLEASVVHANKGEGIVALRELTGATGVLFAGDDVTDERGFAVLQDADVGIKVGPGETAAQFRVESPEEFAAVLEHLHELRLAAVGN